MKKFLLTVAVAGAWALAGSRTAQAAEVQSKTIAVPFAFHVEKMTLPAGHYRVEQNPGKHVVFLMNVDTGHRVQLMRVTASEASGRTTLTFEKTGQSYKLAEIS